MSLDARGVPWAVHQQHPPLPPPPVQLPPCMDPAVVSPERQPAPRPPVADSVMTYHDNCTTLISSSKKNTVCHGHWSPARVTLRATPIVDLLMLCTQINTKFQKCLLSLLLLLHPGLTKEGDLVS